MERKRVRRDDKHSGEGEKMNRGRISRERKEHAKGKRDEERGEDNMNGPMT